MIWVLLIFAAIFFFSIRPIIKQKQKRDLIWVGLLFLLTLTICLLKAQDVFIPSLSNELANLMKSIGFHYPPLQ